MHRNLMGITCNLQYWMQRPEAQIPSHPLIYRLFRYSLLLCGAIDQLAIRLRLGRWIYAPVLREFPCDPHFTPRWSIPVKCWYNWKPYLPLIHQRNVVVMCEDYPVIVRVRYRKRQDPNQLIGQVKNSRFFDDIPLKPGFFISLTTANIIPEYL